MAEHFPLSLDSGDNQSVDGDKTDSRHADFFPEMKWPEWLDRDLGRGESYSPSTHATVSGSVEARSGYTVDKGLDRSWMQLDSKATAAMLGARFLGRDFWRAEYWFNFILGIDYGALQASCATG